MIKNTCWPDGMFKISRGYRKESYLRLVVHMVYAAVLDNLHNRRYKNVWSASS